MFFTYILFSEKLNKYYIGSSDDPEKRLLRHNAGHSKFTKTGIPWKIMYKEVFNTRAEAFRREQEIKNKKSRSYLEKLINGSNG